MGGDLACCSRDRGNARGADGDLPWCAIAGVGRLASPVVEMVWCVWPSPCRRAFDSSAIREFEGKSHDRDRGEDWGLAWLKKLSAKHFPRRRLPGVRRVFI